MNFIVWLIIFCEIAFWVVIILGLVTRYILKQQKLGLFFFALTPIVDLILLITTVVDLMNGAIAEMPHAIAAVYISMSLVFGKSMVNWADDRFRYYIMKQGSKPYKLDGLAHAKNYAKGWLKHLLSYIIGTGILHLVVYLINDKSRTEAMDSVIHIWTIVIVIDLIICISYFLSLPKRK
ncbi:hypothetical protein [Staphylococcus gallinarum]|uniref:hypothetical protein n=1 Tax=Staphylococcus gallinarum TaxID=1293 RepID=UPI000D1F5AFC|nr:hypothetical protein [Staphylococcus gallinarum]PTK89231.1 hypothetical protein BUZ05_12105 [Staphylococcus gallinarum]PTK92614.1 hypothetical protein BUZ13_07885 [Staphylococcus gallinarum]RIO87582.1 hypothetical protein BUZ06_10380 [Staphylococcus gallinarum]